MKPARLFFISLLIAGQIAVAQQVPPPAGETLPVETESPIRPDQPRIAPPEGWTAEDTRFTQRRYTVEIARFPSAALAESVRTGLMNMGWKPVFVESLGGEARVAVGDFTSIGEAQYIADELRITRTANARVVARERGAQPVITSISGPLLKAFVPSPQNDEEQFEWERAKARIQILADQMQAEEARAFRENLDLLSASGNAEVKASPAVEVVRLLEQERAFPDAALYLAGKVARGDWPGDTAERLYMSTVAADLLYGHRRDWRGAWAASRELLNDPSRRPAGRTKDMLRQAALLVELASGPGEVKPSWSEIRSLLRRAWETAPAEDQRLHAKIELMYLQTFAWEGRWDRVEELAQNFRDSYPESWAETGLASIFYARSLGRHEQYEEAVRVLDRVLNTVYDEPLMMGYEPLELNERASRVRSGLLELSIGTTNGHE